MKTKRAQTLEEEKANTITHALGILFTLIAIPILLKKTNTPNTFWAVLIFGIGMLAVYISSTMYHAVQSAGLKQKLKICDHISIYFLIGGTYVPIVVQYVNPKTAIIFFIVQWSVILIAAILKLFFTGKFEKLSVFVYVFLGWSLLFLIKPCIENMPFEIFKWIMIGGLSYSIGVFFYRWQNQKYAHAIWHLFVLGGTVAHYIAIYKIY